MSSSSATLVESAKKAAAYQAVDAHLDPSYRYVGIGSGSTVVYVVEAIAAKGPAFSRDMLFFPTGSQSVGLITRAGLRLCHVADRPADPATGAPVLLDVAFDGADEVDDRLNCIKGGGACLYLEKVVAQAARAFVVVADYRKLSPRLLTRWPAIPIEVHPAAAPDVLAALRALGSPAPAVRSGLPFKAGEGVTDNGMWIVDAPFPALRLPTDFPGGVVAAGGRLADGDGDGAWEVDALAREIKGLTGVLEVGLFWGLDGVQAAKEGKLGRAQRPVVAYFGMEDGSVSERRAS